MFGQPEAPRMTHGPYNGLNHMIAVHEDTDTDADVDANDKWFYPVHDERWRMVANFRESDTAPKEEWINQDAGLDGHGGSSYINGIVLRNKDANTAWTSASDGTLEERIYLCQNWRGDVSALVYANGDQVEQVRYSPYGTPFGLPGGDTDSDGDCDATDVTQIQTWTDAPAYDVRGDIELDGDVDATDKSIVQASYQGLTLGRGKLSSVGSKKGWAGYSKAAAADWYEARNRCVSALLGRWNRRDPLGYVDSVSLMQYGRGNPLDGSDPLGSAWGSISSGDGMSPQDPQDGEPDLSLEATARAPEPEIEIEPGWTGPLDLGTPEERDCIFTLQPWLCEDFPEPGSDEWVIKLVEIGGGG